MLLDNGKRQKVTVDTFATGVAPIALIIAVQSAGISAPALDKVRKIGSMIQPLITGERGCASLVSFDGKVQWLEECTHDPDALVRAFRKLRPGDEKSARMLDAVHESVKRVALKPNSRRVLLVISESRDRGSETDLQSAVTWAQAAGVAVYSATYSAFRTAFTTKPAARAATDPPGRQRQSPSLTNPPIPPAEQRLDIIGGISELIRLGKTNDTQVLAKATGAETFSFTTQRALENTIEKLGAELHTQYLLSFVPESPVPGAPGQADCARPSGLLGERVIPCATRQRSRNQTWLRLWRGPSDRRAPTHRGARGSHECPQECGHGGLGALAGSRAASPRHKKCVIFADKHRITGTEGNRKRV